MALRARKSQGRAAASHGVNPAHPAVCCARATAAVRPSLRARSLPARPPPRGSLNVPLLRNEKQPHTQKQKRASHAVQAAESSCTAWPSVEPWWPSRLPFGALARGLDGFGVRSVREGLRDSGAVEHDGPVPPGLPSHCVRRQTRRDEVAS